MFGSSQSTGGVVYLVDGSRTPFLKAKGKPGAFAASDLAVAAGRPLLSRMPFEPSEINEVILGCAMPSADEANIARIVGLRLGTGNSVPGWTVQRNCASGLQSLDNAYKDILLGRHELVLAGGVDAMSRAPLLFSLSMASWLGAWYGSKSFAAKLKTLVSLKPNYFMPIISLLRGLRDPLVGLSMGQTAEIVAHRFGISREEMDAFAARSHARVIAGKEKGAFEEIETLFDYQGKFYDTDDGVRDDSTPEKLKKLKPFFDKIDGKVTAANSSQVTDGAAMMILASEKAVQKYKLSPLARVVDVEWAAIDPSVMGLGPVHAISELLQRQKMKMDDIDYWEINEAFAAQVIGCQRALADDEYCRKELGLEGALGNLPDDKLNIDGGAIALGHPIGASGTRVTLHAAKVLQRQQGRYGVASLCIGGGQGGAILLERA